MAYNHLSLKQFIDYYPTEAHCRQALMAHRWPEGFICPKCRHTTYCTLHTRRAVQCYGCGKQVSLTAGTVLAHSKLPLRTWFLAIYLASANKQGISAMSLHKHLEVSYPTAWSMLHKLRWAMKEHDQWYQLTGAVCVDEAYIGDYSSDQARGRGRSATTKTPVAALVEERGRNRTGYVHLEPLPAVDAEQLHGVVLEKVAADSVVRTDAFSAYRGLGTKGYMHVVERSRGGAAAISQFPLVHRLIGNFKNTLLGTYRQGCQRHLDLYAAEFCYRMNRRNWSRQQQRTNEREDTLFDRLLTLTMNARHRLKAAIVAHRWEAALC